MRNPYTQFVDYEKLDPIKRDGLEKATLTARFAPRGFRPVWGDSAFVLPTPGTESFWVRLCNLFGGGWVTGLVGEGLGTKNKRLEEWLTGVNTAKYWECIGMDTFAMNAVDLGGVGISPKVAYLYLATGGNTWLDHPLRWKSLHDGWLNYCMISQCVWGAVKRRLCARSWKRTPWIWRGACGDLAKEGASSPARVSQTIA